MRARVILPLFLLVGLGACGGDGPSGAAVEASLRIEVRDAPGAAARTGTLVCGKPNAGTGIVSDAGKACATILENDAAKALLLNGPPGDRACTMVFGGPQIARVTGTFSGRIIDRAFKRSNGCEIGDWDLLEPLLGKAEGGGSDLPM